MKPEQRADLRDSFQSRHGGAGNAGSTLVLDGGMTWKAAQISPEDAELLETRKFGVIELCRLFQVPPSIVQAYENNTFTNAAQEGLGFATRSAERRVGKACVSTRRPRWPPDN